MRRLWLQLTAAAVFLLAWTQSSALGPKQESGTFSTDPPTPYTHYLPKNTPRGRVLVVHGLDANKEVMALISSALADGGFEVYAIDLPGHGDSKAKFQTAIAEQAVQNVSARLGQEAIVLGHSLGAGLLLDLAASQHFSTMVLLSPPPIAIGEIRADHVLIATGAIDLPRIRSFVPIAADIGGPHVDAWILPWAAHSTPIFNPVYIRRVVEWLGGDGGRTRTLARIVWLIVMFGSAVAFGAGLLNSPAQLAEQHHLSRVSTVLVQYIAACGVALIVLKFVNPFRWLHLFGTDYLIGFLFAAGGLLAIAALYKRPGRSAKRKRDSAQPQRIDRPYSFDRNSMLKAVAAAAYVIAILGLVVGSRVMHMSLSNGRWWRFPCIFGAGFPLFAFDEVVIRRLHPHWKSVAVALITRGLLLAFLLTGVLILNRESTFLVLIAPLITIFWIVLWFAAGIIYKNTQDAIATALFSALVQGWAFAAWFVTI